MRRLRWAAAAAVLLFAAGFGYARFLWGPGPESLERQRREVKRLGDQLERRLRERERLREAEGASVLVGVPVGVAERLAGRALTGLTPGITLTLRDLRLRKEDEVRARVLLERRTVGRYSLRVHVHEVRAVLRPREPRLRFAGDRAHVALEVAVEQGKGTARLRFRWDGRGVAGAVCGDLDVTHELAASVPARTLRLEGALRLRLEDGSLVAEPEFEDVVLRLPIEPSAESWRFVDELVERRGSVCRAALRRADLKDRIRTLLERGIKVTLPARLLERTLRLPLAVERSLSLQGRTLRVDARPAQLVLTPARLWYALEVGVRDAAAPPL